MIPSSRNIVEPANAPAPMVWMTILAIALVFFGTEHLSFILDPVAHHLTGDEIGDSTSQGNLIRQVSFSLLGLFGLACMVGRPSRPFLANSVPAVLVLFFLTWCLASILWTAQPSLTVRRLGVLILWFLGALGVSRKLSPRDLCVLTLTAAAAYVAMGILEEMLLPRVRFRSPYRFAGLLHPNTQASYCALLCLAAMCLAIRAKNGKILLILLFLAGLCMLGLTRARGCFGSLMVALFALWLARASLRARAVACFALVWVIGLSALWCLSFPTDPGSIQSEFLSTALLGRVQYADSVGGRIPLWGELFKYILDHPVIGYGYGAFWTPSHVEAVSSVVYWGVGEAHSAYLEMTLGVGLIGSCALGLAVAVGAYRAGRAYSASGDAGHGFIFASLVFAVVYGLVESPIVTPTFLAFSIACGFMLMEFRGEAGQ